MRFHPVHWLLLALLAIVPIGCEGTTVVDDEPDGATVVEDDDTDTVVVPDGTDTTVTPPAGTGTNEGVDVHVNTPTTPPASDTDSTQNTPPNANQ